MIINMETMNKMHLKDMESAENISTWYFCPYCQKQLFKGNVKTLRMTCPNCNRLIESDGKSSVFPEDADIRGNNISIPAPIGIAILGHKVGESIEWIAPSGLKEMEIIEIHYQPETCGQFNL